MPAVYANTMSNTAEMPNCMLNRRICTVVHQLSGHRWFAGDSRYTSV